MLCTEDKVDKDLEYSFCLLFADVFKSNTFFEAVGRQLSVHCKFMDTLLKKGMGINTSFGHQYSSDV